MAATCAKHVSQLPCCRCCPQRLDGSRRVLPLSSLVGLCLVRRAAAVDDAQASRVSLRFPSIYSFCSRSFSFLLALCLLVTGSHVNAPHSPHMCLFSPSPRALLCAVAGLSALERGGGRRRRKQRRRIIKRSVRSEAAVGLVTALLSHHVTPFLQLLPPDFEWL